jgi:hypothetical protein
MKKKTNAKKQSCNDVVVRIGMGKKAKEVITKKVCNGNGSHTGGAIYGLGFLGALVYYVSTAPDFWAAVLGFFKALLWPAFIVYGLLKLVGA